MAGSMIPVVTCEEFDFCGQQFFGEEDESTINDVRRRLRLRGWCTHYEGEGYAKDYCPVDGCCPRCSSQEALEDRERLLENMLYGG